MHTQADYEALISDLVAVEDRLYERGADRHYITDSNVDAENAIHLGYDTPEFWDTCYRSAAMAAGGRCEDYGLDINALLGRVIY